VFYELLTGAAPFLGTPHEVLFAHLGSAPKPLPDTVPQVVQEAVMRLLRKRPEERFQDAAALDQALEECESQLRAQSMPNYVSGAMSQSSLPQIGSASSLGSGLGPSSRTPPPPSAASTPPVLAMPSTVSVPSAHSIPPPPSG